MFTFITKRDEKAELVETFTNVLNAPETARQKWRTKDGWRKIYRARDYLVDEAGAVIVVCRPGIEKTVYYDDEYPNPLPRETDKRKAYWMELNLERFDIFPGFSDWLKARDELRKDGYTTGTFLELPWLEWDTNRVPNSHIKLFKAPAHMQWADELPNGWQRRTLTEDEIAQLEEVHEFMKARYIKRLETYWRRYSDQIASCGYWANR